jgi:ElaB/YqjD/DUF883 family membrane-anchored ribosome-binding protein
MTRKNAKSQGVVERLLEQQRQYQDWLEKLDQEAAGAAPSHVARRVRADYAARLNEVTQELSEHEDGVRQALAEAEARADGLTKQHAERTDELSEARLRRQVGEFDEQQYEEIASRCKDALTELSKELATVERDIDRYEEILTLIKGVAARPPAPPPVVEAPPAPAPGASAPAAVAAAAPKPLIAEPPPARVSQPQMNLDEMAFLRSLTERGAPSRADAKVESPRAEPARPEPPRVELPAAEGVRAEPPAPHVPAPEPRAAERPQGPRPAPAPGETRERRPPDGRESEGGTKTLVCTECGTKNLPSEWYCEKCGAELAPY